MEKNKSAFTLIELIVSITILTILSTIGYLSFIGYAKESRDSVRKTDLNNIKLSLELYSIDIGKYPNPSLSKSIVYSGYEAWKQGVFGTETLLKVGNIEDRPYDSSTGEEYTYSVTNGNHEYEVAALFEKDYAYNNQLINKSYAGKRLGQSYVVGKYNGKILKIKTSNHFVVLAVPTIISGNPNLIDLEEIISNNELAYNGTNKLASSYSNTIFESKGGFGLESNKLLLYSGSLSELISSDEEKALFLKNLQYSYSGTIVSSNLDFQKVSNINIDLNNPTEEVKILAKSILNIDDKNHIIPSSIAIFKVNTSVIFSNFSPIGSIIRPLVNISFETNLSNLCRYSNNDINYTDMVNRFTTEDNFIHTTEYISSAGINKLYIKCIDTSDETKISNSSISFEYIEGILPVNIEFSQNDGMTYSCNLCN